MATPINLSHHLSVETRARLPNPMKAIARLTKRKPNMVSLANGDPHFSLYPIKRVEFELASVDTDDPVADWTSSSGPSAPSVTLTTTTDAPSSLPLKAALQYSGGNGLPETQRVVTELTNYFHAPPDHCVTLTLGNGDAITKCFRLLGSPGDHFLADEYSFSAMTNAALPQGITWVPIRIDAGGLIPESLEAILAGWDESRGRRPHVLYSVPCGQNPTGSTLSLARRKQIYKIAQRYDIVIIEDDPYYYLQYDSPETGALAPDAPFIKSMLSLDTDGRVLRIDSFSKIMAPGMRLGWITSSALFHSHLVSLTDSSTQHPHAFGQLLVSQLLGAHGWGATGFDRWVRSLRDAYRRRRDFFLTEFTRSVSPEYATPGMPQAGMFVWITVHIARHPRFREDLQITRGARTNTAELMDELFERLLDAGLVLMPASVFAMRDDAKYVAPGECIDDRLNFLRATYAGTEEAMEQGLAILGQTLKEFFAEEQK